MKTTNHIKGIIFILLAAFGFSLMTFFVRISGDLPTMQKVFFRNSVALIVAVSVMIRSKEKIVVGKGNRLGLFLRCFFGTTGVICNFYAIDRLGIADANMLNKLSPFFAILLSIVILKEIPNKFDIITTVIAFIGALFIIRPTGAVSSFFPAIMGLIGGFGAGAAYVFVRKISNNGVKTPVIVAGFSLFSCLVTLPFLIFDYSPMSLKQLGFLVMAGVAASLGQFSITTAYKYAPAKEISVFDYTQVIFAALLGFAFFGEIPVALSFVGYGIIITVAVIRWNRNRKID
ncbi:MAG: DMT family transporter [Pseudobutyrivibrio sp.]|uniref:DMT family transporter n=2 Tax=Lachnospiraceae TaxID=186803 RepID=A0A6M0LG25_PSEXY|nr:MULTISPECIES: DMT family transporter [Pseudobutyrivibrio]MBE5904227.1 DMT family transporter [Pseudobutyrivibrio sp.]NEX01542.1 DMT family transporter [Pseudobutyrivibrio xylanivorans]SFR68244.1 EamA domain-containing membrane protein RarD [Pseudobutyrivibrio sp. NOR37]